MTRKDVIAQFTDELVGLLTRAFAEDAFCQKANDLKPGARETMIGQFIVAQWKAGKSLLERFAEELKKADDANSQNRPAQNGTAPARK